MEKKEMVGLCVCVRLKGQKNTLANKNTVFAVLYGGTHGTSRAIMGGMERHQTEERDKSKIRGGIGRDQEKERD
jgi:hypothetical protein